MQKITPFLWFNDNAGEAMDFYVSVFKDSKVVNAHKLPDGKMLTGTMVLEGQELMVLNGGPHYSFTPAISLFVKCKDQEEVDYYWDKLSADPKAEQCGWLKDKFGLSWQIIPDALGELLGDKDPMRAQRAMQAMMQMKKIDIAALRAAAEG